MTLPDLVRALIAINSANPATCNVGRGEFEIATFCKDWLTSRGVFAELVYPTHDVFRPGVSARSAGEPCGRKLLLLGHLDTYTWYAAPLAEKGLRLRGAGASDMKGGIAVIMLVLARLAKAKHYGTVSALLVPDEEHASLGMRGLGAYLEADAAIVLEDSKLDVGTSHPGRVRARLQVETVPKRELLLRQLRLSLCNGNHRLHGFLVATVDRPKPSLILQREISPGEDAPRIASRLLEFASSVECDISLEAVRESFRSTWDNNSRQMLLRTAREYGVRSRLIQYKRWTEASILAKRHLPTIIFGPGGAGAHTDDEWLDISQGEQAVDIVTEFARNYCGKF